MRLWDAEAEYEDESEQIQMGDLDIGQFDGEGATVVLDRIRAYERLIKRAYMPLGSIGTLVFWKARVSEDCGENRVGVVEYEKCSVEVDDDDVDDAIQKCIQASGLKFFAYVSITKTH